ncbi:hypothetical protein M0M57_08715 [Flavobacterium azooxidireducens]|uniref:Uncharacterized protein n=1 Tax=Flavobacterium azooxidireducens TaxID=1871076 RepID=A0ABY4KBP7_9FLAO|nr:hypothetical protein [Flavobacterium azooxidireducens]UPQ77715.1 hypothetical protein M0M57_08715 [Flavobacterium azooxidireducens]
MKNYIKTLVFFLSIISMISCSDDDSSTTETFDITEYIIIGKSYYNLPCIIAFSTNGKATIVNPEGVSENFYSFDGTSLLIDGLGIAEIENAEIIDYDIVEGYEFNKAKLVHTSGNNDLKGKKYSGTVLSNYNITYHYGNYAGEPKDFTIQFHSNEDKFGSSVTNNSDTIVLNKEYTPLGNSAGYNYIPNQRLEIFYIENNELIFFSKIFYYPGIDEFMWSDNLTAE